MAMPLVFVAQPGSGNRIASIASPLWRHSLMPDRPCRLGPQTSRDVAAPADTALFTPDADTRNELGLQARSAGLMFHGSATPGGDVAQS